jgi:hypothetical protein
MRHNENQCILTLGNIFPQKPMPSVFVPVSRFRGDRPVGRVIGLRTKWQLRPHSCPSPRRPSNQGRTIGRLGILCQAANTSFFNWASRPKTSDMQRNLYN